MGKVKKIIYERVKIFIAIHTKLLYNIIKERTLRPLKNVEELKTMEMNEKEKIFTKVKKLLALSSSKNTNEAQNAMLKARELLAKHNLSMAEFETTEEQIAKKEKEVVTVMTQDFIVSPWKKQLAFIIAKNFKCSVYGQQYTGKRGVRMTFLGLKEDVEVCTGVYAYALDVAWWGMEDAYGVVFDRGENAKGVRGDYIVGFLKGLSDLFEKQNEECPELALALVQDEAVVEQFKKLHLKKDESTAKISTKGNQEFKEKGYNDGLNFTYGKNLKEKY